MQAGSNGSGVVDYCSTKEDHCGNEVFLSKGKHLPRPNAEPIRTMGWPWVGPAAPMENDSTFTIAQEPVGRHGVAAHLWNLCGPTH